MVNGKLVMAPVVFQRCVCSDDRRPPGAHKGHPRVGCSAAHLSDVLAWKKQVSLPLAMRMSLATNGEVPVAAFAKSVDDDFQSTGSR